MKIGEKQRTMLAQTQYSVLSASLRSLCVCVMSGSQILHWSLFAGKLIRGDIKFLSEIKYFPDRPSRLSGLYVTGTKQLFCRSLSCDYTGLFALME